MSFFNCAHCGKELQHMLAGSHLEAIACNCFGREVRESLETTILCSQCGAALVLVTAAAGVGSVMACIECDREVAP